MDNLLSLSKILVGKLPFVFFTALFFFRFRWRYLLLISMYDEEVVPPAVAATGFVSENETNFCFSDDDVIYTEEENIGDSSGW